MAEINLELSLREGAVTGAEEISFSERQGKIKIEVFFVLLH